MEQSQKPLVESLVQHARSNPVSFHVPGHKSLSGYDKTVAEFWGRLLELDITELEGMDDLHCAQGVILEAQRLAAQAYGVDRTYFLVNGSTGGILSALMAAANPGDKVLIDRQAHSSVINGIMLGRLEPVYIGRPIEAASSIPMSLDIGLLSEALASNPDAVAVVITNPNYYGICSDIEAISNMVGQHDKILIVDEAHGAHFKFCRHLPTSAVDTCADLVIQSAHKTLPAMTQGSWLHLKGKRVDRSKLEKMLGIFQTTSPSYPIMASLDAARCYMASTGALELERVIESVGQARQAIEALDNGLFCPDREYFKSKGAFDFDDTRLIINTARAGISGCDLDRMLRCGPGIYGEFYDMVNWVGVATVISRSYDLEALIRAIGRLGLRKGPLPEISCSDIGIPPKVISPWQTLTGECQALPLKQAAGRISASSIIPYPPGVPLLCPGERITCDMINRIEQLVQKGIRIKGLCDQRIDVMV
jgi:lysine decarboxylase